jgi:hypothetical protein
MKQIIYRNLERTYRIRRLFYSVFREEILERIPRRRKINSRRLGYKRIRSNY